MTVRGEHPIDDLQELLDGRLNDARRAEVERHVASCEPCRFELETLRTGRDAVRGLIEEVPPRLEANILGALDREDRERGLVGEAAGHAGGETGGAPGDAAADTARDDTPRDGSVISMPSSDAGPKTGPRFPVWTAAAAVIAIVSLAAWLSSDRRRGLEPTIASDDVERPAVAGDASTDPAVDPAVERAKLEGRLPSVMAADFRAYRDGDLTLATTTRDPLELESFFETESLGHETRVLDLAMMDYTVAGGGVVGTTLRRAMFVYEGPEGVRLMCQMFAALLERLPEGGDPLEHDGIAFRVYERDGVTIVFWMEGDVMCALSSDAPRDEVVGLALEKAMKALAT